MSDSFYRAFEDRHRGSRELIKSRLSAYAPFLRPLALRFPSGSAIDLGCGRGEWLELLGDFEFDAYGVDLDEGMLAACREHGLKAQRTDALKALQGLPDASTAVVSAFHLIEHLPFEVVKLLIRDALRVLKPGGLLILETPNPENLVVGATSFYMDPSHIRPIPPDLLDFVVEHAGFQQHKVVRLQESVSLSGSESIDLFHVLNGVSPDYSVVAQKHAAPELLAEFAGAFKGTYGISLGTLVRQYDLQAQDRISSIHNLLAQTETLAAQAESRAKRAEILSAQAEVIVNQAEARSAQAEVIANQAEARSAQAEVIANQAEARSAQAEVIANQAEARSAQAEVIANQAEACSAQAEFGATQAEAISAQAEIRSGDALERAAQAEASAAQAATHAAQLAAQLHDVFHSRSWRITAPLRFMMISYSRLSSALREGRFVSGGKRHLRSWLRLAGQAALRRPWLKQAALRLLDRVPAVKRRLHSIMFDPANVGDDEQPPQPMGPPSPFSPRTLLILDELARAIDSRKP